MDDLSAKLSEFLSNPEGMEKVKDLMGLLTTAGVNLGGQGQGAPEQKAENPPASNAMPELPFDPLMLLKMKSAMDLISQGDPRVDLLVALKPNLSDGRQKRVDDAIRILRVMHLMPLLREQGFL